MFFVLYRHPTFSTLKMQKKSFITAWNIGISRNILKVPARILPVIGLICNKDNKVTFTRGNKQSVGSQIKTPFYKPNAFPPVWALINLSSSMDFQACNRFYEELKKVAADRGIDWPAFVLDEEFDVRIGTNKQIIVALEEMVQEK